MVRGKRGLLALGAILFLLLGACTYSPDFEGTKCSTTGECPDGFSCTNGVCRRIPQSEDGYRDREDGGGEDSGAGGEDSGIGGKPDEVGDGTDWSGTDNDQGWWNEAWSARRKIFFDNSQQTEALVAFPVLVVLTTKRIDYGKTAAGGADIRFLDEDDRTVLPHEIELWKKDGDSFLWVGVPRIDGGSRADFIWMYYGNDKAADDQEPAEVWSDQFSLVYHLDSSLRNSTGLTNSAKNDGTEDDVGQVGRARRFVDDKNNPQNSDHIHIGDDLPILNGARGWTMSAWIKLLEIDGTHSILSVSVYSDSGSTNTSRALMAIGIPNNGFQIRVSARSADDDGEQSFDCNNLDPGIVEDGWYNLVGVADYPAKKIQLYVDGSFVGEEVGLAFQQDFVPWTNSRNGAIGSQDMGDWFFFHGVIDELHLSNTVRSADWIRAQFLSISNTGAFLSFADAEARP